MDKKKLQEAEEQIKTALLYMNYNSSKTLTENKEEIKNKKQINELVIPAISIAAPWLWAAGAAGLVGVGAWINGVWGGGDSFEKTKKFFEGCNSEIYKNLKPTLGKTEHRAAADSIYDAIEGLGTNKNEIKTALSSMTTVADLCAMYKYYKDIYGDLYDDLDSDIDGEDFRKYVWVAIAPQIQDAMEDLEKVKEEENKISGTTEDNKKEQTGGGTTYKPCTGTYTQNCKSDKIREVQRCLGLVDDGKFGLKTQSALESKGFYNGFTDSDVSKICAGGTTTGGGGNRNPYKDWQSEEPETGETSTSNVEG